MFTLQKWIEWDMGHRVPGHHGACRNPHGHRYRATITVEGIPADDGMIVDFGIVKTLMMEEIHDPWDHAFLSWDEDHELVETFDGKGWKFETIQRPPTAEHLAQIIYNRIAARLPDSLRLCRVDVRETPSSIGSYAG